MQPLPYGHRQRLLDLVCKVGQPEEFEAWLAANEDLQDFLSRDEYLGLMLPNLRDPAGLVESRRIAESVLTSREPDRVARYRVELTVQGMLAGSVPLLVGLRRVVGLAYRDYSFLPDEFIVLESETDSVPVEDHHLWSPAALSQALEPLEWYRESILQAATELLEALRTERTSLVGK
jgi:hypothetical protein